MDTISAKRSGLFFLPLILCLLMGVRPSRAATTVIAWGSDEIGQTDVPVGITNASAISAGYYHNLVLTSDGRVIAWGLNYDGQTNVPTGLEHVRMVSAGDFQSLALTTDGL